MIVVAVYTCGRRAYLEQTLASFRESVSGAITRVVVFDDSGDPEFTAWLRTLPDVSVASWGRNRGFGGSRERAWRWLLRHCVEDYVFDLEEDFTFDEPVNLDELARVLDANERLDQVALLRHACFPREHRAGGIVEQDPDAYTERSAEDGASWLEHELVFTTNPNLYRRSLCATEWPDVARSERVFTQSRVAAGQRFAYWQGRPLITHIGDERTGHGY